MPPPNGGPAAKNASQIVRKPNVQGMTTRSTSNAREPRSQEPRVQTKEEAREWLFDKGFLADQDDAVEVDTLKAALTLMANRSDVPTEVKDGMRAVLIAMDEVKAGEAEKLVVESMGKVLEEYRETLENMAEATVKTVKDMAEQAREMVGRIEEGQVVEVRPTQGKTGEGEGKAARATTNGMNFAQAARKAEHEDVIRRARTKSKQMIVDNTEGGEGWKGLAEKELVEKAKIAKDLMGIQGMDSPKVEFLSARKLRNGGVLYELNSAEAAEWLAKPDVRKAFLDKFGAGAKVKDRVYNVFVEFVPVGLGDNPAERMELVEEGNGLHPGELVAARWARAPRARHENQKVAHLVLSCASEGGANGIIRNGLIIEGKRVSARKLDQEPRRCLKCQRYGKGHIANECKQEIETCGLCAKNHRTKECKETDPKNYSCINCKARGIRHDHPSSSRLCPSFVEAKNRLMNRSLEMRYKYYPTDQQWTWLRVDNARAMLLDRAGSGPGQNAATGGALGGITYRTAGQGRLAGGERGQGGGAANRPGEEQRTEGKGQGKKTAEAPGGTQTTLDSYRWADSEPSTQEQGRQTTAQQNGGWNEQQYNEFLSSLQVMAEKARQLSPNPSQ